MKSIIIFSFATAFAMSGSFNSFGAAKNVTTISHNAVMVNNPDMAYAQYANLQKALANDDAATAQKAATELVDALKDISGSQAATKAATAISKTKNIKEQRKSFAALSVALENLFKANKPDNVMIYIHYCPMAKAYWMSNSKDIQNPYFGKSMLSCGKTTGMIM